MPDESIRVLVEESLAAEKEVYATISCKNCGRDGRYTVAVPDYRARTQAFALLADQAKGRPDVTVRTTLELRTAQTREELQALSDEELQAIIDGDNETTPPALLTSSADNGVEGVPPAGADVTALAPPGVLASDLDDAA